MICILSNMTMEIIKFDVISAKYYSIECDEVTSHKRAYMSVIVRYVYDYRICERCIKLHRVSNLTGKSLADVIIAILANMNFPICNLVGKGFDGASSMSGKDEGVQQHLTVAGADKSTYFHCFAHKLNLVLEKSVKNVPYVNDVFDIIGCVYRYLEGSPKRHALYEEKLQVHDISQGKIALHTFSDTRWTARSDNLDVVLNTFPAIISMFKTMSEEGESAADGLLVHMQKLKFVASSIVLKNCFGLSRSVSEYLQHEDMDLVSAVSGVQSLKDSLASFRNEEKMDQFLLEARQYCTDKGFVVNDFDQVDQENSNRPKRRRTIPSYFNDHAFVLDQDAGVIEEETSGTESPRDVFKRDFFSHFWIGCRASWKGGSLLKRVKYCRWPMYFIPDISKKKIQSKPNNWPNSME